MNILFIKTFISNIVSSIYMQPLLIKKIVEQFVIVFNSAETSIKI